MPMFPFCDSITHSDVRTRSFRSRVRDAMPQTPPSFILVSLSFARFLLPSNTQVEALDEYLEGGVSGACGLCHLHGDEAAVDDDSAPVHAAAAEDEGGAGEGHRGGDHPLVEHASERVGGWHGGFSPFLFFVLSFKH